MINTIYLRKGNFSDIQDIMIIIDEAKKFLQNQGSTQWQDGHPNINQIRQDVDEGVGQVLIVNNQVAGYVALTTNREESYLSIKGGKWMSDDSYATIHRMAISSKFRGMHLSNYMMVSVISKGTDKNIYNFRVDTHPQNLIMQNILKSIGFQKRGQVKVDDKLDPNRMAFELNL
ncbi:GNAT family N-acetyltransferase [Holzapfeliella sp. JNUCC 80]